jgi:hypothetical protein
VTENQILRKQMQGRVQLTVSERGELAAMGQKLGKKALEEIATVAKPDTILAWHRMFNVDTGSVDCRTSIVRLPEAWRMHVPCVHHSRRRGRRRG